MISDSGAKLYACKASVEMFNLERKDFIDQIEGIITVGDFYQMAGGRVNHLHLSVAMDQYKRSGRVLRGVMKRSSGACQCSPIPGGRGMN